MKPNVEKTKTANKFLLEILDKVKLDKVEEENARKFVEEFIEDVLIKDIRKDNKLFDLMFNGIFHSGSFYDDTKIEDPYEFDLNIVLDLKPFAIPYEIVRLEDCPPGYIMIQVDDPSTSTLFEILKDGQDKYNFFEKFHYPGYICSKKVMTPGQICSKKVMTTGQI